MHTRTLANHGYFLLSASIVALLIFVLPVYATAPSAGGDTTVVNPSGEGAVSVNEDAVQPESANIRLIVPTLTDSGGGTPDSIRILSVSGGTLWTSGGSSITLGSAGSILSLSSGKIDFRFRPDAGRDTDATFLYVVVDPHDNTVNSAASTATISINAVNDAPVLQTISGNTGIGLAATYYLEEWDLTGPTLQRIDATVNFSNNFGVTGLDVENFSARWTGQVKSPITGNVTFSTASDDGVRLWIDDELIIDNWTVHGTTVDTATALSLEEDEFYDLRLEFYERGGGEVIQLRWAYSGQSTQVIPQEYLFPATTRPALQYVNGADSAIIDDAITIADVDSAVIASGSVVISTNYESDEDSLLFTNQNGITGNYADGTLSLTGTASLANYQTALRSVRYANSAESPTDSTRTIQFRVSDNSGGESNFTFRNIEFTGENTPPVITEGASASVTMDQDASPIAFSLTLNATDADFHSIEWSISGAASHGTASVSGNGDSKAISYAPTAGYSGSDSFIVQISDGNGGTDTITVNVTITERVPPVISAVTATSLTSSSATISWTTDESASTKVTYGLTSSYGTTTAETDTSPRVTSHSKVLTGLKSCTLYHYAVISVDAASNSATSVDYMFTTAGCVGDAPVRAGTGTNTIHNANGSTGTIILTGTGKSVSLSVPTGYIATNPTCPTGAQFQMKELSATPVKDALGAPSGRNSIVTAHNFSAYCPDQTPVTEFDESITLTFAYADSDIAGLVESSLGVYRYGSGSVAWDELTCTQDAAANTMTCTTTEFSSFGMFGTPVSSSSSSDSGGTSGGGGGGGCRGSNCKTILREDPFAYKESRNVVRSPDSVASSCSAESMPNADGRLFMPIDSRPTTLKDVPVNEWFACSVHGVIEKNIFSGYRDTRGNPTGLYGPADFITVGQLAKVAVTLGKRDVRPVVGKDWALPYMKAAEEMKLSAFAKRPAADAPATRGMVIRTLLEALDIPMEEAALPYSDVPQGSLYAKAVSTATVLGIVSGDDGANTFRPNAPVNRAEVAKMIMQALRIAE